MIHKQIANLRAPSTLIVVERDQFVLHLFKRKRGEEGAYHKLNIPITVGKVGDATPSGCYYIDAKTRKPDWMIPEHEDYPPETWRTIVPFEDPHNPFAGGFLSLSDKGGVGIHGTKFDPQTGTRSSHGCIRVSVQDLNYLYKRVPLGTAVIIV